MEGPSRQSRKSRPGLSKEGVMVDSVIVKLLVASGSSEGSSWGCTGGCTGRQ